MKRFVLIICLFSAVVLCGCTEISDPSEAVSAAATVETVPEAYPVTVYGLTFSGTPESVASLSPAITEMIFELGFSDKLVCRSSFCDYPPEAEAIPSAGSGTNPDFEKLSELAPTLLITQSPIANKDMKRLSEKGVSVLMIPSPSSREELYDIYEKLSLIFAGSIDWEGCCKEPLEKLKNSFEGAEGSCESAALILNVTSRGFMAATGDSFAGDYISCFGENAFSDKEGFYVTAEELIAADPQVIILAKPLTEKKIGEEIAEQLSAFDSGRVYTVDSSILERPTSRLTELTDLISEELDGADQAENTYAP